MTVLDRFLNYVKINTESAEDSESIPSTPGQWDLAKLLIEELNNLGAADVRLDEHCYVYATIPASDIKAEEKYPVIGFIAHLDTSCAVTGRDVKPVVIRNYDGKEILLNKEQNYRISPVEFPELVKYAGQDLVVTDGTTLLGADDKAGVAEIMAMAEYFLTHPEAEHGTIRIGFTPDEEVGCGADLFDVPGFAADYAYTVDGGELGEIEYENFNAASGKLTFRGKSVHPGSAKNKMVNAVLLAMEFQGMLPVEQNPAYTEGYEGFYHVTKMTGVTEEASMHYILRDHDRAKLEEKKTYFLRVVDFMNEKYGAGTVTATVTDTYYNMREMIEPHPQLVTQLEDAMRKLGIVPKVMPIRGGTDGARLSYEGLLCPNLCTGGGNFHGRYEYACVQSMEIITKLLCEITMSAKKL